MPLLSPSSRLYKLGRGKIFWTPFDSSGLPSSGAYDLGVCEDLNFTMKPELAKQYGSQGGIAFLGAQAVSKADAELTIEGKEFSSQSLAMMFMGTPSTFTQSSATITGETITPVAGARLGGIYRLAHRQPSAIVLTVASTPLVLGSDYTILDPVIGLIQLVQTPLTSALIAGAVVTAAYTAPAIAGLEQVAPGTQSLVKGALLFAPSNADGINQEAVFYSVTIEPDQGPSFLSLKAEYTPWKAKAAVLNDWATNGGGHGGTALQPFCNILFQTAT